MTAKLTGSILLVVAAGLLWATLPRERGDGIAMAEVVLPTSLSEEAELGMAAFEANCASCHGINAAGQEGVAPPLVHVIYEPSHHSDASFYRAAETGVRAHHWSFGDMPPVTGLSRQDMTRIISYIRSLQRANGIR